MMKNSLLIKDLLHFLNISPTPWHAVSAAVKELKEAGFRELSEQEHWDIEPEKKYFVTRNGSSLCAFVTPQKFPKRLRIIAAHTDSPSLKLKPQPEIRKHQSLLLGVEIYGSPLLNSWLNRDLGIAGRIFYKDRLGKLRKSLVRLDEYPVTIPQLAIHLDREIHERGLILNKQDHLNALAGIEPISSNSSYLDTLLRDKIEYDELVSHDLFLFPLEPARLIGYQNSLVASYRIDNLASVHAALKGLIEFPDPLEEDIKMIVFWDNEEVGSKTPQGAESTFFSQILERVMVGFNGTREDYFCLLNHANCFSVDLAHALHPNYAEKHDSSHPPFLGRGIVLKNNAQQRYATNAFSSLALKMAISLKDISLQTFVNRNDMPCGSTIGPIHASNMGIPTVDIGIGQLSMHSCRELMSCQDHIDLCALMRLLCHISILPECESTPG